MAKKKLDEFPLSSRLSVHGNRRLVREKALQMLMATEVSSIDWRESFQHVFGRDFSFVTREQDGPEGKQLTTEEVMELESDIPIVWEDDSMEFAKQLLMACESHRELSSTYIERNTANWDLDRIALMDRLILRLAIAELLTFPLIPTKVTVNEYIDLAKKFSTEKSNVFINGVIDVILQQLKSEGRIQKEGRGLVESSAVNTEKSISQ